MPGVALATLGRGKPMNPLEPTGGACGQLWLRRRLDALHRAFAGENCAYPAP